jgi:hypothetical protein
MPQGVIVTDRSSKNRRLGLFSGAALSDDDDNISPWRGGRYSERYELPLSDFGEGSYFKATHQTPGTTTATDASIAAETTTSAIFNLFNNGSKWILMDCVKLLIANADGWYYFSHKLDIVNRYLSGGLSFTPQNVNSASATASAAVVYAGTVGLIAENTVRRVSHTYLRNNTASGTNEINFTYYRHQGAAMVNSSGLTQRYAIPIGPLIVAPGHNYSLHFWSGAGTAGTVEIEAAWWER